MRIALDATPLLGPRTGVATFTVGALGALAGRPDVEAFGYALSWRGRSLLREHLPAGVTSGWSVPAAPLLRLWRRWNVVSAELILDTDGGVDVVHGTNYVVPPARRAARVVTVHDLTSVRYPELCTAVSRRYPALVRRAVDTGAWVHTPSEFIAEEVVAWLGIEPTRVRAVHHGVTPAPTGGASPIDGRYVLALGTVEPRKDLPLLVRAFDRVAADRTDLRLAIAGPDGWGTADLDAAIAAARHGDRIIRLGYVDGEVRGGLLAHAAVFAFPSIYEGFGLPPLEAMAAGVPVVATAGGAVPEVCGDAASIVPVGDADALACALAEVLDNPQRADELRAAGRARAATFGWERCADGLLQLYRDAVGARG